MASAKDIVLRPIPSGEAITFIRRVHYSGKVTQNAQLHIGVFLHGQLEGVMSFGPSLDKRKLQGLVAGTGWNEFIELNRMAFTDVLPRNSESRALSIAIRLLRKHAPHVKWIVTFADATQCGDGTIYRAAGFVLTQITKNDQIWSLPGDERSFSRSSLTNHKSPEVVKRAQTISRMTVTKGNHILETGASSMKGYVDAGFRPLPGFQLRYLYFIDPTARERLTVPILPNDAIEQMGAGMYRGQSRAGSLDTSEATANQAEQGGANPTSALHSSPSGESA